MNNNSRSRAPLLWLLGPLVFGYILGDRLPQAPPLLLIAGGCLGALATLRMDWGKKRESIYIYFWPVFFIISATFLAWGYYLLRLNLPHADWEFLPPREAELVLRTERTFQSVEYAL